MSSPVLRPGQGAPHPGQGAQAYRSSQPMQNPRAIAPISGAIPPLTSAPTLGQFWRSDIRGSSLRRRPLRWPGLVGFWVGIGAFVLLIVGIASSSVFFASVALAFSVAAAFFSLIGLIAGLGRVLGFFGLLFALAGNIYVVMWLARLVGIG